MKRLSSVSVFLGILILIVPCLQARDMTIAWAPNTETDLVGYHVWQSERPSGGMYSGLDGAIWSNWVRITSMASPVPQSSAPTYVVTGLADTGTEYIFMITAIDADGNESPASNPATVLEYPVCPDCQPPNAPEGVHLPAVTQ